MSQNYKTVYYKGDFWRIPIADYSFNPGDYVETKDGKKGYIKTIVNSDYPEFLKINIDFGEKGMSMYSFYIHSDVERLARNFNRIGVYDFTSKIKKPTFDSENDKRTNIVIEPLKVETASAYCNSNLMWNKINELIEAVNNISKNKED